ncbi:HD domain-containing protein [Thermincola potens]|uniref:Metal dependent phosphohydrolase n=1 Tax=Thermincola potens (strain JR) TaxID=635013 RepID=D5X9M6_THEPJ|nr:HD domain-containing protein [Thermincola potens]ADG81097.1 metal dependent phosphohydrolase [Thermincola potens JR]
MDRVEKILKDPFYQECIAKNEVKEAKRKFCKHAFQHMVDVARVAYILIMEAKELKNFIIQNNLGTREKAREVIYAAALLHDIARWHEYETGEDHAVKGAEIAEDILKRAGFDNREITIICQAIKEHRGSFTENMSLLGEYLHRADNLSRSCYFCPAKAECYKFDDMETGVKAILY